MRIVREGTPTKRYRLQLSDLPADFDLRNSYLRYVDLTGFDLSAYDVRDSDIIDYEAQDVAWPDFEVDGMQATDYMQLRRGKLTGSKLPTLLSSYNHDFVVEAVRQNIPNLTGKYLDAARIIETYIGGDYGHSWRDGYWQIMDQMKVDKDGALEAVLPMFKGFPKLESRLRNHHTGIVSPDSPTARFSPEALKFNVDGVNEVIENVKSLLVGHDRYALRLEVRQVLRDKYISWTDRAQHFDVWFAQLDPYPIMFTRDATTAPEVQGDDWFLGGWPT